MQKEKECNQKRKPIEYCHTRRTLSLMKINEELNREISELESINEEQLENVSAMLDERIKALNCLYDISSLKNSMNFSLDEILQGIVDLIPPAIQCPEAACARIQFDGYAFTTKNFKETKWMLSQEVRVNNERIGALEVFYLKEKPELQDGKFLIEAKSLITAIGESIAQIVEREWAEIDIRKYRNKLEKIREKQEK